MQTAQRMVDDTGSYYKNKNDIIADDYIFDDFDGEVTDNDAQIDL